MLTLDGGWVELDPSLVVSDSPLGRDFRGFRDLRPHRLQAGPAGSDAGRLVGQYLTGSAVLWGTVLGPAVVALNTNECSLFDGCPGTDRALGRQSALTTLVFAPPLTAGMVHALAPTERRTMRVFLRTLAFTAGAVAVPTSVLFLNTLGSGYDSELIDNSVAIPVYFLGLFGTPMVAMAASWTASPSPHLGWAPRRGGGEVLLRVPLGRRHPPRQ